MDSRASALGLDPRSLAAFRVGLGVLLLLDLAGRLPDLEAHLSDSGVLPRATLAEWTDWSTICVHAASGSVLWQGVLATAAAGAALALILGWRTRAATAASWFLLASLHARNPAVLHGGDALLRVLLFWSLFVPLGRVASLDRLRRADPGAPHGAVLSAGTVGMAFQISSVYWFSGLHKLHPVWWENGTAIEMALRLDQLSTRWGRSLLALPDGLLVFASRATLVLELAGPLLVWIPFSTARLRGLAVALFVGFHLLGLAPALHLGLFPWVCAVAWTVFLPAGFWEEIGWRFASDASSSEPSDRPPPPLRGLGHAVAPTIAVAALVTILLWNLRTLDHDRWSTWLPDSADPIVEIAGLHQLWTLFAPTPSRTDGWFSMPGTFADGTELDVWTGRPPTVEKPASVAESLGSMRWSKFLRNLPTGKHRQLRRHLGEWICLDRNRGDGPIVEKFEIHFHHEPTALDGTEGPVEDIVLWRQWCPEDEETLGGGGSRGRQRSEGATSGSERTPATNFASRGDVSSFRHTRANGSGSCKSGTGRRTTPSGQRQRVAPLTNATPSPHDTRLRIVASLTPSCTTLGDSRPPLEHARISRS